MALGIEFCDAELLGMEDGAQGDAGVVIVRFELLDHVLDAALSGCCPRGRRRRNPVRRIPVQAIAWAMPFGGPWAMYVNRTLYAEPSPKSSRTFSGMLSPRTMPMSVIHASRRSSMQ